MFHRRHKSRKRTRSRSPSSRQNSASSPDKHHEGLESPPKTAQGRKRFPSEDSSVDWTSFQPNRLVRVPCTSASGMHCRSDEVALSIMAGETSGLDIGEPSATEASFKRTATSPFAAPVEPIQAPLERLLRPQQSLLRHLTKLKLRRILVMIMGCSSQLPNQPPGNHQLPSPSFWILTFEEKYLTSNLWL